MNSLFSMFISSGIAFLVMLFMSFAVYKENTSLKDKSTYSVCLSSTLFLYVLSAIFLSTAGFVLNDITVMMYIIFGIIPFIIAKISSYKHSEFYVKIQIAIVIFGIIASIFNLTAL